MINDQQIISVTLLMAAINVLSTLSIKEYAGSDRGFYFAVGAIGYVVGAMLYVILLRSAPLEVLAVATTLLQVGLMMGLSVWFYGSSVSVVQWLGLSTGMLGLAIVLVAASA